jgi:hemerythrin-like domain-containing protein
MKSQTRRSFLINVASTGAVGAFAGGCARHRARPGDDMEDTGEEEVTPGEDLMREHGVLNRILLVYEEVIRRIDTREAFPPDIVPSAAGIVRRFIEDYHEKLEEDYLFPRFEQAGRLVDLVTVLRTQHQRGRGLTDDIVRLAAAPRDRRTQEGLRGTLRLFIRMYRPHEAREDTVLFPAFHEIIGHREHYSLGETFEEKEHQLFGARGLDGVVDQVAQLERTLRIYELSQFTPA